MTVGRWIIQAEQRDSALAAQYKIKGHWQQLSWRQYIQKVISAAHFLKNSGLTARDHAGLMCSTRWEWSALDLALLGSGAVVVPMYPNLSDEDLLYTVNHSEVKILIIENESHQKQIDRIKENFERPVKIISLSDIPFETDAGPEARQHFFEQCESVVLQNRATIVYTSGTTGKPKGAVLLHEALVSEVTEAFKLFAVKPSYKSLTFLPFAHVLGRIEHWGSCYNGHSIAYAESIEKIKVNLKEVKPDFMIAVPRIFEKVFSGIMAQVETKKYQQKIFTEALAAAKELQKYRRTREVIPWGLLLRYQFLNQIAFAPIQKAFGGKLKFAVSGGAPIDPELVEFFGNCGLPILEGYGLTETCAAVAVNTVTDPHPGTVGRPIGDVEFKFAADGEILIKSKKCLTEYFKNPEETAKSIVNGYFVTGDIGVLTEHGCLKITDRKKDLIKTAGGKYVAPQKLEGLLKQDPLVSQVLVHGDQRKFISVLITFDENQIRQWADSQQLKYDNVTDLYNSPVLKIRIQKHIQAINSKLASFEAIKKFEIILDTWTVENGSLTQSLKIKRKFLEGKYADVLGEIYE